jgi:hypothetical protein
MNKYKENYRMTGHGIFLLYQKWCKETGKGNMLEFLEEKGKEGKFHGRAKEVFLKMVYTEGKKEDDLLFKTLFVDISEEYVHNAGQLVWGHTYMCSRMEEIDEISCSFYDEGLGLEETVELITRSLEKIFIIRKKFFEAKERAIENGVEFNL